MTKVKITQATQALIHDFYGGMPPFSMKGFAAVLDDKCIGLTGIYREGPRFIAFSDMRPEMRAHKKAMVIAVRKMERMMRELGKSIYAVCNPDEQTSVRLLQRVGFRPTGMTGPAGEILRYEVTS